MNSSENIFNVMDGCTDKILFTGKYSECRQYTLNEYLQNLDRVIQPVTGISIGKKVVISPRVNQPWGGQEGEVKAIRFTGIDILLEDGSTHEFSKISLYERKTA